LDAKPFSLFRVWVLDKLFYFGSLLIVYWDLTLFNWPFYVLCRAMAFLFGCVSLIILKLFLRSELLAVP